MNLDDLVFRPWIEAILNEAELALQQNRGVSHLTRGRVPASQEPPLPRSDRSRPALP